MEPPGSGAEPVEDDHIQETAHGRCKSNASSNGAPSAAVPPPPRATPLHRREQAGGGADGSSSAAARVDRKGKGTLPPKAIPSPPSSAGSSSSSTPSVNYAAAFRAGAFGGRESSTVAGGSKARVTWSDPAATETREVPNAAAHPFGPKLVSTQRLVKEQAAVDKENRRWEQQFNSLRAEEAMHRKEQSVNQSYKQWLNDEVAVKWSDNDDDGVPYPLHAEFCGDSYSSQRREWTDVRIVRRLRGLRLQERLAARNHFRALRDSQRAGGRKPSTLFRLAMDNLRDGELVEECTRDCDTPEYLTCPLSGELMIDPVTIATGKTFDRQHLKDWFEKNGHICPVNGEPVSGAIVRNERIRGYLREWEESKMEQITKV
ncbi:uncharacterized protein LOC119310478 [Triticum dicoccoides]|uniref:uncharacterized protein LOC119310478 n=1 Tax=Triticum dicoccoides TaxID=85692 RepID=UPI000843D227|nr:uncharacterized protein LOC119310478 [Triticum dicoccoides]XP_044392378.1 uncharacterized protein LOC123115218 [Triticum aestivum]